ncbi:MAG: HD domain-containing protein [Clostridia bacterium]|nr:HD domain-containing protein [Clostridia bacterium]
MDMVTTGFGICLMISVLATLTIVLRRDDQVDSYDWSLALLIPFLIMGYWLKTLVASQEASLVLFAFINLSTTVLLGIILFSLLHHLRISIHPWLKVLVYVASFFQLLPIWSLFRSGVPDDLIQITDTGDGYATRMTGGSFAFTHIAFFLAILIVVIGAAAIIRARKKTYSRRTLALYIVLVGIGMLIYTLEYILNTDFSALPFLYMIGDVLIALYYDRSHMHDIFALISQNEKNHNSRGYLAIGTNGWFLSANEKCFDFLPELRKQRADTRVPEDSPAGKILNRMIRNYTDNGVETSTFRIGEMTCAYEISAFSFRRGGMTRGYLIDLRDVTEEKRNLEILADFNRKLNQEVEEKTHSIENIQQKLVLGLADMVENRDSNTGGHVKRTSDVIRILVEDIQARQYFPMDETFAKDIIRAAPMHDLGKVSIDSSILNKPGRLTPEEYDTMKTHSTISGQMVHLLLDGVEEEHFVRTAFHVARFHHERWDGNGYPEGLVGEMIPLEARIMSIADVYDALVSKRVYKEPMSFEKAAQIMVEGMGTQFDPNMLLVFLNCREKVEHYYAFIR